MSCSDSGSTRGNCWRCICSGDMKKGIGLCSKVFSQNTFFKLNRCHNKAKEYVLPYNYMGFIAHVTHRPSPSSTSAPSVGSHLSFQLFTLWKYHLIVTLDLHQERHKLISHCCLLQFLSVYTASWTPLLQQMKNNHRQFQEWKDLLRLPTWYLKE